MPAVVEDEFVVVAVVADVVVAPLDEVEADLLSPLAKRDEKTEN